jgi:hypothetical protein
MSDIGQLDSATLKIIRIRLTSDAWLRFRWSLSKNQNSVSLLVDRMGWSMVDWLSHWDQLMKFISRDEFRPCLSEAAYFSAKVWHKRTRGAWEHQLHSEANALGHTINAFYLDSDVALKLKLKLSTSSETLLRQLRLASGLTNSAAQNTHRLVDHSLTASLSGEWSKIRVSPCLKSPFPASRHPSMPITILKRSYVEAVESNRYAPLCQSFQLRQSTPRPTKSPMASVSPAIPIRGPLRSAARDFHIPAHAAPEEPLPDQQDAAAPEEPLPDQQDAAAPEEPLPDQQDAAAPEEPLPDQQDATVSVEPDIVFMDTEIFFPSLFF